MSKLITIIIVTGIVILLHGGKGYCKVRQINYIKQEVVQ
jgi:hypothetical protein